MSCSVCSTQHHVKWVFLTYFIALLSVVIVYLVGNEPCGLADCPVFEFKNEKGDLAIGTGKCEQDKEIKSFFLTQLRTQKRKPGYQYALLHFNYENILIGPCGHTYVI